MLIITYDIPHGRRINMTSRNTIILASVAIAVALLIGGVLATIISSRSIPSSGTISGINLQLYESDGSTPLTSVPWGTVTNGTSPTFNFFVNNTGTSAMMMNMTTNSWSANPSNSTDAVMLTWNREGSTVPAGSGLSATLTLAVQSGFTVGCTFTMNIVINGTY
jgi:hypothetical protein